MRYEDFYAKQGGYGGDHGGVNRGDHEAVFSCVFPKSLWGSCSYQLD